MAARGVGARRALGRFLADVERRALTIARIALRDRAEAKHAAQDAMTRLVRNYGRRPQEEWRPLFYRILKNRIADIQRRAIERRQGAQPGAVDRRSCRPR